MRIRSLTLKNFRGFEDATLDLDRPLTVLFGVNGSGKSSVPAACSLIFSEMLHRGTDDEQAWCRSAKDTDIRQGADSLSLTATWANGDVIETMTYSYPRDSIAGCCAQTACRSYASVSPVFYEAVHLGQEQRKRANLSLDEDRLAVVRRAVAGVLPGFSGPHIDGDSQHMGICKDGVLFAVDQLSGGELRFFLLAVNLARRLILAYPRVDDPLHGEAVALIDDIELHLHPSWQRGILGALRRTFPKCQFIVTTHSPQVLSEVPNDAVVLVRDFVFARPVSPTAGRDTNAVLSEVMGTPERPAAQIAAIRAIAALLYEGRPAEARARLDALVSAVSERDHDVVELRTTLHFLGDEQSGGGVL